jgi:hypothetical protein
LKAKAIGVPQKSKTLISGKLECEAIRAYLDGFPPGMRGPVLRKQKVSPSGVVSGTMQIVGVHILEKVGIRIALDLNLADADDFTSHTMRRSAICRMVEAGMSLSEMKLVTGVHINYIYIMYIYIYINIYIHIHYIYI